MHAGAQWQKAQEVFESMRGQGCTPDVVTYTALISAFEKACARAACSR
jgi:pentatricopeptide repeat domain-containing protein 1